MKPRENFEEYVAGDLLEKVNEEFSIYKGSSVEFEGPEDVYKVYNTLHNVLEGEYRAFADALLHCLQAESSIHQLRERAISVRQERLGMFPETPKRELDS